MDNHASSSRSHPKTLTDATSTSKVSSSSSADHVLNTWVEDNAQMILKAMATLKRAKLGICMCPRTVARYSSTDGTEEDLRSTLGLIYRDFGPIHLRYRGCDGLARHWVAGWDQGTRSRSAQKVMMRVEMKKILPGQSPVLDRLRPSTQADSDEESDEEKGQDKSDWVDVGSGGDEEDDWLRPNDIMSIIKDAGDFFLDALKALRKL